MRPFLFYSLNAPMLLLSFTLMAQDLPEITPPSPTVANLMQFEEVPVSYYTGQPNISIPIYSKAITGDLGLNIDLSYNTQGVKINNRSGWTGTGWSLNAGGVISRTVRGEPDEISTATSANKMGIYHLDDYWNYDSPLTDKARFNYRVIGSSAYKYDNKPDLYQFNFMGYSGRFVILKQGSTLVPEFISKSGKFKIEFTHSSNYVISAFTITDTKGYIYTFDVVENSYAVPTTGIKSQAFGATFNINASQTQQAYYANTAWHLTKIETSNGNGLVSFSYSTVGENYTVSVNQTSSRIIGAATFNLQQITGNAYNQGILEPRESITYHSISTPTKKLNTITFLKDNTTVHFSVDPNYIHPEINGRALKNITVKNGSTTNKAYSLTYEETTDTSSPIQAKRVWLTKVTETAGTISQDYVLDYYNKQDLPGFNTYDVESDSWGYYSGIDLGKLSCTNSVYSDGIIKTGLLTSIKYPTGGVKEFVFEHNAYSYYQDQPIGENDYLENPRNTSARSQFTDNATYTNGSSPSNFIIDTFTLGFEQDIYISSWVTASPGQFLNDHRIKIYSSTYSTFIDLNEQCTVAPNIPPGNYTMALVRNNNINLGSYTISGDYRVVFADAILNPKQEMIGGGVRIKDIIFKDGPLAANAKKTSFVYDGAGLFSNRSSGVIASKADRLERRYIKNTNRFLFANTQNICEAFSSRNIQYEVVEKQFNAELTQGSYVGYRHVRVLEQNNGHTTYSYTSPYEYPSPLATFDYEQPKPKANLDYKRGLLLEQKTFDQAGQILKEVSYLDTSGNPNYEFSEDLLFKDRTVFRPDCGGIQFYDHYTFYASGTVEIPAPSNFLGNCSPNSYGPAPCGIFPAIGTDFKSGWAKLKGIKTKEYFYGTSNGQTVKESRQEFIYNTGNYQIAQQDSYYKIKGVDEHIRTKYFYPVGTNLNSNPTTIESALIADNKVNEVLESQSFRNGVKLNETHTIYANFSNLILPKEVKVGKGSATTEKRIEFIRYDVYGNPLEVKRTNGASISYIYGFNRSVPVAKITNATYSNIEGVLGNGFNLTGNLSTAQENSLRTNLPNALIFFYRYDVLKGVISTLDEKGYEMTYGYDALNRLEQVKDAQGKILSENTYYYKNQ